MHLYRIPPPLVVPNRHHREVDRYTVAIANNNGRRTDVSGVFCNCFAFVFVCFLFDREKIFRKKKKQKTPFVYGSAGGKSLPPVNPPIMLWGSSPRLDLSAFGTGRGHLRVLIVAAGDARHALQTVAKRYGHSYAKIDVHVYEPVAEMYARQLQQIALALEPVDRISLAFKVTRSSGCRAPGFCLGAPPDVYLFFSAVPPFYKGQTFLMI